MRILGVLALIALIGIGSHYWDCPVDTNGSLSCEAKP